MKLKIILPVPGKLKTLKGFDMGQNLAGRLIGVIIV